MRRVSLLAVVCSAVALAACGTDSNGGAAASSGGTTTSPSTMGTVGGTTDAGTTTSMGGTGGTNAATTVGGAGGMAAGGSTSSTVGGAGGAGGLGGSTAGGTGGGGGTGGTEPVAPENLSETGLFSERASDGSLVLMDGVMEFEPTYWLWSDGSDKKRYVYLPPGSQINTSDPDHWVMPTGAKLWKSFIVGDEAQLVETRLIERTGDGENDWLFATYYWETADAADATLIPFGDQLQNAAGTTHDIPNGFMCERCHGTLKDRALGFSALQLNHDDRPGINLETLMNDGWLTDAISLDIKVPGDDQLTQDALGYLHANCGNCHNDSPGIPLENVPEPQMYLRVLVGDQTFEDTGAYQTALNQPTTATSSTMLGFDTRIVGGDEALSAMFYRMNQRLVEDQMPPIGTEITDPDGLELIQSWIESLPPP